MKNKTLLLTKLSTLVVGFLMLTSSCGEDNYYETIKYVDTDPSANWHIITFSVEPAAWKWDAASKTFNYKFVGDETTLDEFLYENGVIIGYAYFGTKGRDEIQVPLPTPTEGINGMNFSFDSSMDLDRSIVFYYHTNTYQQIRPTATQYFKIAMLWPKE